MQVDLDNMYQPPKLKRKYGVIKGDASEGSDSGLFILLQFRSIHFIMPQICR